MFPPTRHTLLRQATGADVCPEPGIALNALIAIYWQPCVRYVLLRWRAAHDRAEDIVQEFFRATLEQDILQRYDRSRGPFRSYLRSCLDHVVLKELERINALKRGGDVDFVTLTGDADLPGTGPDPDELFEKEWRRTIFELALRDLEASCRSSNRWIRFEVFRAYDLAEEPRPGYAEVAIRFAIPQTAVTNHLNWSRRELRRLVEARINSVHRQEDENAQR